MNGMDFLQLRAIVKAGMIQELRGRSRTGKKSYRTLISLGIVYGLSGFYMGGIASAVQDSFTAAFLASTFFMIMAGSFVLMEYPTLVTGAEDFSYYASRPVSPQTYFLGKLLTILGILSICFAVFYIPFGISYYIRSRELSFLLGALLPVYGSGIIISLLLVNFYGMIVKVVPFNIIRGVSSLLQVAVMFLIYGASLFTFQSIRQGDFNIRFSLSPLLMLSPSSWLSALFKLGELPLALPAFTLGVLAVPLLLYTAARFISMDYAEKIASYISRGDKRELSLKGGALFSGSPEEMVIFRIIKNQFRYNPQFRTGVLIILPITVFYFLIVLVLNRAPVLDPFTPAGRDSFLGTIVLYVAVGFFPMYIKNALIFSSEAEGSWIFFVSPADRVKLILGARKFILIFFLGPYLLIFMAVFLYFTQALLHTLMHFLVITLLALILTNVLLLFFAELPFTRNPRKGRNVLQLYLRIFLSFLLPVPLTLFVLFVYPVELNYWLLTGALFVVAMLSEYMGRRVAAAKLSKAEFLY